MSYKMPMPEGRPRKEEEGETIPAPEGYQEGSKTLPAAEFTAVKAGQEQSESKIQKYAAKGRDDSGIRNLREMAMEEQKSELENAQATLTTLEAESDQSPEHGEKVAEEYARVRRLEAELEQMRADERRMEAEATDRRGISEIRKKLLPPPPLDMPGKTLRYSALEPKPRTGLKKFWDKLRGK